MSDNKPVAWRYEDARGHYRYRGFVPGFDVEYAILKPVPLYTRAAPPAPTVAELPALPDPTHGVVSAALQQAFLALEELQGPGFLIGGVMHYRIGWILPKLNEALELLAADRAARPVLTDEQIWNSEEIMSINARAGLHMPILVELCRAVLAAAQGSKP
jgi:hypothetical protein